MRVLALDVETTGLQRDSHLIEFAMVCVDITERKIYKDMSYETLVKCPSYETLEPVLCNFVKNHNKNLIKEAHFDGLSPEDLKSEILDFLHSDKVTEFFGNKPPKLFGKSLCGVDIPMLNLYFGSDFFRRNFSHVTLDLSSVAIFTSELDGVKTTSSRELAKKYLGKDDVDHTALEDCYDCADILFKMLDERTLT